MRRAPLATALLSLLVACSGGDDEAGTLEGTTPPAEPVDIQIVLTNLSSPGDLVSSTGIPDDHVFAPGIAVVHDDHWALFSEGVAADAGVEALAEDGNNAPLLDTLEAAGAVDAAAFAAKDDTYADAPMLPGDEAVLWVEAVPGDHLTVATMVGQSNDWFASVVPGGFRLFDADGAVREGDHTAELRFYDAGTEADEEYGAGASQAPRQAAPGEGDAGEGYLEEVTELPPVELLLRLEIRLENG